jgi:hypothetical protein
MNRAIQNYSLGMHRKQSIRHIIDSPKVERWVAENLVQPHPPKMVPLPLGFFPPNCQDDRVGTDATYDAAADLGPSGVCANLWPTIRGYRRELLDRPLNMACSGHVRDSSDYEDRSTLASHCAETGDWNRFAVTPVGEVWLGPVSIGTRSAPVCSTDNDMRLSFTGGLQSISLFLDEHIVYCMRAWRRSRPCAKSFRGARGRFHPDYCEFCFGCRVSGLVSNTGRPSIPCTNECTNELSEI